MAAMSSVLGTEEGAVTPETIGYYRARAEGGTGLIVVEFSCVDTRFGRAETRQLSIDDDRFIDGHRALADAIKASGARAALQLQAPGQYVDRRTLVGMPAGPSEEVSRRDGKLLSRALTSQETGELVARFGDGAQRAMAAGYEAIELHGAHGYLLMAFLSPLKNRRDDEWGGDFERRLQFPLAVIRAVKAVIGPDRPLIYRLSSSDFLEGGLDLDAMLKIAPRLAAAGVDAIHVSSGAIDGTLDRTIDPMSAPEGWRFSHCRAIRESTGVPVIGVGPARWPDVAEKALSDGDLDMIALGRPLLADPDWTRKALAGRAESIRPCTNCNWCFDRVLKHLPIGCAENPRAGQETHIGALRDGGGRLAIVVGAGPGGMAAALDLVEAGFRTRLYEARRELGGGLISSASPPHKDKLFWYLDHLKGRLANSEVDIRLGCAMDAHHIIAQRPDLVILATGAQPLHHDIEGFDRADVLSAYNMLIGDIAAPAPDGRPILVYGGGETGCETAEFLTERGHDVILVTRSPARDLARSAEAMYRKHLRARLAANPKLAIREKTTLIAVRDGGAVLSEANGETITPVAAVVVAQGRSAGAVLADELAQAGIRFRLVGDVEMIGRIGDAVHAARRAVLDCATMQ